MKLNRIITGDNVNEMYDMENEVIDLTVTSPPYDNLRDYTGYYFNFDAVVEQLYRVTKEGGVVVWVVGDATIDGGETGSSFKQALRFIEEGFRLHDTMIYEKNTSSFPARREGLRYTQIFEYMFVFSKGRPKTANLICDKPNKWAGHTNWGSNTQRGKDGELKESSDIKEVPTHSPRNNIWRYVVGGGFATKDKIAHKHPAIFPEQLAEDHILSWSNEEDVVLDLFGGSGTTAKMSIINKRNYIYIDVSEEYSNIAKERIKDVEAKIEQEENQSDIFDFI